MEFLFLPGIFLFLLKGWIPWHMKRKHCNLSFWQKWSNANQKLPRKWQYLYSKCKCFQSVPRWEDQSLCRCSQSLMTLIVSSVNFPKNGETSTVINLMASVTSNFIKKVTLNEEKVAERECCEKREIFVTFK